MRRRKHSVDFRTGAVDLTAIPVTREDLSKEWNARKEDGMKKLFVSFLKDDTEYVYAFRFLKADLENNTPTAKLAFIRTKEYVCYNEDMHYGYLCGYQMTDYKGLTDFHQPLRNKDMLQYAIPTLMSKIMDSEQSKNRCRPQVYACLDTKKYGMRTLGELHYIPDEALQRIAQDVTYYLGYIMRNSDTLYVAEMLSKLGHSECLLNRSWFSLKKQDLIAMVRYAQKAKLETWDYNIIRWNMSHYAPEKVLPNETIRTLGTVKNHIKWATEISDQREILTYLEKQKETLDTYEDYFHLRDELKLDYDSHSARYPSNLTKAHNELLRENISKQEVEENKKIMEVCKGVVIESDRYIPEIPQTRGDLRYYGKMMDDCLGMKLWFDKIVDKRGFIFILSKEINGEKIPYLACEVERPNKRLVIKQLYLSHNKTPDADTRRYVANKILPQLENQILI